MNQAIFSMLEKYQCHSQQDYENALKEIIQEIALLGLWQRRAENLNHFYEKLRYKFSFSIC